MVQQDDRHGTGGGESDVDEKRPAQAGETATTRFGLDEGSDTDGAGTGGIVDKEDAGGGEPGGDGPSSGTAR
jgi:hypothetical protein